MLLLPSASLAGSTTKRLGYCPDELPADMHPVGIDGGSVRLSAAIHLPWQTMMRYEGMQVTRIRFAVSEGFDDVAVWIRTSLEESSRVVQSVSEVKHGWNEVTLSRPLAIDGQQLYIGYTATQPAGISGILAYGDGTEHTSWLAVDNQWADYHEYGLGVLFIQAVVEGEQRQRGATVVTLEADRELCQPMETVTLSGLVENLGETDLDVCELTFTVDGEVRATQTIQQHMAPDATTAFTQQLSLDGCREGRHELAVVARPSAEAERRSAAVFVYESSYPRKLLLEHFTSLPCVNCPPVDELLEEVVGRRSDVAWVSHHVGYKEDEFTIAASQPLLRYGIDGNPYVMIDRTTLDGDRPPFTLGGYTSAFVDQIFSFAAARPAMIALQTEATIDADGHLSVSVSGEAKTFVADLYPRATLHVYLLEDQVYAEGTQAGNANKHMHDNIFRQVLTPVRGQPVEWDADGRLTYSVTATPDAAWEPQHLRVVAFVAAQAPAGSGYPTGEVLNAAETHVVDPTIINNVRANDSSAASACYSLDGRRISLPTRPGVYVVGGRKVVVR